MHCKSLGAAVLMILLALTPAEARAANWVEVAVSPTGTIWTVDADRIRRLGSIAEAWVRLDHSRDRTVTARNSLIFVRFNCTAWTSSTTSVVRYRTNGTVITDQSWPEYMAPFTPIVPETVLEGAANAVCGRAPAAAAQLPIVSRAVSGEGDIQDCFNDLNGELIVTTEVRAFCTCTVNRMVQSRANEQQAMAACFAEMRIASRPPPGSGQESSIASTAADRTSTPLSNTGSTLAENPSSGWGPSPAFKPIQIPALAGEPTVSGEPHVPSNVGCAENGSCYGDISTATGRPRDTYVHGYVRRDGTYVRSHYRSHR